MRQKHIRLTWLVFLLLVLLVGCSIRQEPKINLSEDNIKTHLSTLTSRDYEGRMIGTKGNDKTIEYIENYFRSIGLNPINDNGYSKKFEAVNATWDGVPSFSILNERGERIASYEEEKDYRVRLDNVSVGGSFKGNLTQITKAVQIYKNEYTYNDLAVLIDYENPEIKKLQYSEEKIDDRLCIDKAKVIIYPESIPVTKRDINMGSKNKWLLSKGIIKIGVSQEIYDDLIDYMNKGYIIDINVPVSFHKVTSANVFGVIPSKNNLYENYIMIATSIDGLGSNWKGQHYPSISDNGASTALFLELARFLMEENIHFDSTIVFAAFNGKHTGSVGVEDYLRNNFIVPERTEVIYLNKLGTTEESILQVATFLSPRLKYLKGKAVLNQLSKCAEQLKISYEQNDMYFNSEHILFRNSGIIASVLTYDETHENLGTIGESLDDINISKIKDTGDIVAKYIYSYGNMNLIEDAKDILKSVWWLFIIGVVLIMVKFYSLNNKSVGRLGNWLKSKPIIFVCLIFLFCSTVITLQTKHNLVMTVGVPAQDVNITFRSAINMLIENLFTTIPMIFFMSTFLLPLILFVVILHMLSLRFNIKKSIYFLTASIITYFAFMSNFIKFYDYRYIAISPKPLSLFNSHYIVILLVALFSVFVTYLLSVEIEEISRLKLIITFILLFFLLVSLVYSPYIFSKAIVDIKASGGRLKF